MNSVVLAEIADVLNMGLGALDSWSWCDEVKLLQTRKISGVYNIARTRAFCRRSFCR